MSLNDTKQVMLDLLVLNKVLESLQFLASVNVIHPDSIIKGCKKYVKDHPAINEYLTARGREY